MVILYRMAIISCRNAWIGPWHFCATGIYSAWQRHKDSAGAKSHEVQRYEVMFYAATRHFYTASIFLYMCMCMYIYIYVCIA